MTTIEKINRNTSLLRPTDLSIKSCLSTKYNEDVRNPSLSPPEHPYSRMPFINDQQWKLQDQRSVPSPMALVFGHGNITTMAPTTVMDSAAKLVVLDSLISQCSNNNNSGGRLNRSPPLIGEALPRGAPRSRGGSDSSSEKFPVGHTLFDAVQGLAELQRSSAKASQQALHPNAYQAGSRKVPTPPTPTAGGRGRGCKRKGGWKFHDLSDESDGLGRRKRAYCHNKLENEILQLYQDRVCIKEVPGSAASKLGERLVVIEPSYVTDSDLIKYNTGLRIVFDKKRGTYRLQVLPFTIEQGSLSNKSQVLGAVAKMLGENGAVLCPGITRAFLTPHLYAASPKSQSDTSPGDGPGAKIPRQSQLTVPVKRKNWLGFTPAASDSSSEGESSAELYRGRWKILNSFPCEQKRTPSPLELDSPEDKSAVTPTDRLLLTLNKELSKTQRLNPTPTKESVAAANRCLLWHVPTPGGKGKRSVWPQEAKWCMNCLRKMQMNAEFGGNLTSLT